MCISVLVTSKVCSKYADYVYRNIPICKCLLQACAFTEYQNVFGFGGKHIVHKTIALEC